MTWVYRPICLLIIFPPLYNDKQFKINKSSQMWTCRGGGGGAHTYLGFFSASWERQIFMFEHIFHVPHHFLNVPESSTEGCRENTGGGQEVVPWRKFHSLVIPGAVSVDWDISVAESSTQGLGPSESSWTNPGKCGHYFCYRFLE